MGEFLEFFAAFRCFAERDRGLQLTNRSLAFGIVVSAFATIVSIEIGELTVGETSVSRGWRPCFQSWWRLRLLSQRCYLVPKFYSIDAHF